MCYTNKEQIIALRGKKTYNRLEFRINELIQLANEADLHLVIDYQPADKQTLNVVVKNEPEINFEQIN